MDRSHTTPGEGLGNLGTAQFSEREINDEIKRYSAWRMLYDLGEAEDPRFEELYNTLPDEGPTSKAAYNSWADIWDGVLDTVQAETTQRGIEPWQDILVAAIIGGPENKDKVQQHIGAMKPDEQYLYAHWQQPILQRLERKALELSATWTLPWGDPENQQKNAQHWQSYRDLTPLERNFYDSWLAVGLARLTKGQGVIPVYELYDARRNTGGLQSHVTWRYMQAFRDNNPAMVERIKIELAWFSYIDNLEQEEAINDTRRQRLIGAPSRTRDVKLELEHAQPKS